MQRKLRNIYSSGYEKNKPFFITIVHDQNTNCTFFPLVEPGLGRVVGQEGEAAVCADHPGHQRRQQL